MGPRWRTLLGRVQLGLIRVIQAYLALRTRTVPCAHLCFQAAAAMHARLHPHPQPCTIRAHSPTRQMVLTRAQQLSIPPVCAHTFPDNPATYPRIDTVAKRKRQVDLQLRGLNCRLGSDQHVTHSTLSLHLSSFNSLASILASFRGHR